MKNATPATPATTAAPAKSKPVEGLPDAQQFLEIIDALGDLAPSAYAFWRRLTEILRQRQSVMAAADCQPNAHLHGCCDRALESAVTTVAEILQCKESCKPA